jgi:hypothetical protein
MVGYVIGAARSMLISHPQSFRILCHGVVVFLETQHLCTELRGVWKTVSNTSPTVWHGYYADEPSSRAEFLTACTTGHPPILIMIMKAMIERAVRARPAIAQTRPECLLIPITPNPTDKMVKNGSGAIVAMRSHPGGLKEVKLVKPIIVTLPAVAIAKSNERMP